MTSLGVYYFEIIALKTEVPMLDSRWRFGLGVVEDELYRFTIRDELEMASNGLDNLLEDLTGGVSAKVESCVSPECLVCRKSSDISTLGV